GPAKRGMGGSEGAGVRGGGEGRRLKTTVQEKTPGAEILGRLLPRRDSIRTADHRCLSGEFCREQIRFIAGLGRRSEHAVAVRHDHLEMRILTPVAARENADFFTLCSDSSRDPLAERRFSGFTSCDVADTNHGSIEFGGVERSSAIERKTRTRDCAVQ